MERSKKDWALAALYAVAVLLACAAVVAALILFVSGIHPE